MCSQGHRTEGIRTRKGRTTREGLNAGSPLPAPDGGGPAKPAADAGPAAYLESNGNIVDKTQGGIPWERRLEVRACGCRCRFCPHCCRSMGIKLRERLLPVLKTFSSLMMLTLTVDPKLFTSPEHAYRYCRKRKVVPELVKALKRAGQLQSGRYFYVLEWQKGTQMVHYHVLVEADRVDFKTLARLWGRNRPPWAPAWQGSYEGSLRDTEPEFGGVRFSRPTKSGAKAANYALKYVTKAPQHGFPKWVLDFKGEIRLFGKSHRLLSEAPRAERHAEPYKPREHRSSEPPHADTCFCERCRGEVPVQIAPVGTRKHRRTIRERLRTCGTRACVVEIVSVLMPGGELVDERPRFVTTLPVSFHDCLAVLGVPCGGQRRVVLRPSKEEDEDGPANGGDWERLQKGLAPDSAAEIRPYEHRRRVLGQLLAGAA